MGFFKSLKGKFHDEDENKQETYTKTNRTRNENGNSNNNANTPSAPPAYMYQSPSSDGHDIHVASSGKDWNSYKNESRSERKGESKGEGDGGGRGGEYDAPPGPPPSHDYDYDNKHKHSVSQDEKTYTYLPPSGPPPSHTHVSSSKGPDAKLEVDSDANPPPYQSWYSVPDTSLLPPPPSMQSDYSPTNNASTSSKDAGFAWCDRVKAYVPAPPSQDVYDAVRSRGNIGLVVPYGFRGRVRELDVPVSKDSHGEGGRVSKRYLISSSPGQDDVTFLSGLPLYFAVVDNPVQIARSRSQSQLPPTQGQKPVRISFEIQVKRLLDPEASVAISFSNAPYPTFRLPGWHRGSLAIHSDDGRRYVNDSWGGVEFTSPFQVNDMVKLRATIYPEVSPVQNSRNRHAVEVSGLPRCRTQVELERYGPGGEWAGGWDVSEERDERMEGVDGLQGEGDLYAAVGVCGGVEVEVRFWPQG